MPFDNCEKFVFPDATLYVPEAETLSVQPPESLKFKFVLKLGDDPIPFQLKQARDPCFSILKVLPSTLT